MAVPVDQGFADERWQTPMPGSRFKEFAQKKNLTREALRARVVRERIEQFVTKYRCTTRLEDHNRNSLRDLGVQGIKSVQEQTLCAIQHAEIVERTSAADWVLWHPHVVPCRFQNFDCGNGCFWM